MLDGAEQTEQFDRYLDGLMSDEERQTFERTLRHDEGIREAFRLHARTVAGLKQEVHARKKAALLEDLKLRPPEAKETGQIRRFRPMMLAAAAVVIILIGVALLLGPDSRPETPEAWYTAYAEELPAFPSVRGEGEVSVIDSIRELYTSRHYAEASQRLEAVIDTSTKEASDLWFFLGISRMQQPDQFSHEEVAAALEQVKPESLYAFDAEWWTAIDAAQKGDAEKARNLLESMAGNPDHLYRKQAQEALERLRE